MALSARSARRATQAILIALLLLSALAGYAAIGISRNARQLERESVNTTATILMKQERQRMGYRPGSTVSRVDYSPSVTYRYDVDGRSLIGTHGVERDLFQSLQIGQTVPVRYSTSNPSVSEIRQGWTANNGHWAGAASLIFATLAGGLLLVLRRLPKSDQA
jgi:type II secretory pathway pseudopilin PulG